MLSKPTFDSNNEVCVINVNKFGHVFVILSQLRQKKANINMYIRGRSNFLFKTVYNLQIACRRIAIQKISIFLFLCKDIGQSKTKHRHCKGKDTLF